ncbi:hypothetical protein FOYG_04436 [Fusarium oxysporum NRRL 32931]|uniref:Uncharacterized protein n=1 Tax=Fusarium oxysporum NRRL 32931 TaxID=660029 RepID=W9IL67_FUSOX|nr:hypothetical protein FOYG_04436 [Fusarium oxysporum NRRL 32931]
MDINSTPTAQRRILAVPPAEATTMPFGEVDHEIGLGTRGRQFMSLSTCWSECLYIEVSELRQDEKDEG